MTLHVIHNRRWCLLLLAVTSLLGACSRWPESAPVAQTGAHAQALDEYRELRLIKGHFGGGAWDDRVDKFGGRKHRLMQTLAAVVERDAWTVSQLYERLGEPDLRSDADGSLQDRLESALAAKAKGLAIAGYYWRENHDVLIFYQKPNGSMAHAWWYAGE